MNGREKWRKRERESRHQRYREVRREEKRKEEDSHQFHNKCIKHEANRWKHKFNTGWKKTQTLNIRNEYYR